MLSIVLFVLLCLLALGFILRPLLPGRARERTRVERDRERLEREKLEVLSLIRDMEFDWKTSKMLEADYRASRADTERRAIGILKRLDELEGRRTMTDAEIEGEIARLRAKLKAEAVELGA